MQICHLHLTTQGFIQDFLLGGGNHNFEEIFGYFRTAEQTNSVKIILLILYSSAIDQFKYSHFVCLPVYHIHLYYACFSVCEGIYGGGGIPGFPPFCIKPCHRFTAPHHKLQPKILTWLIETLYLHCKNW